MQNIIKDTTVSLPTGFLREWYSIDDVKQQIDGVQKAQALREASQHSRQTLDDYDSSDDDDDCCCCCCLCCCIPALFSKSKRRRKKYEGSSHPNYRSHLNKDSTLNGVYRTADSEKVSKSSNGDRGLVLVHTSQVMSSSSPALDASLSHATSIRNLQSLVDMLQEKADVLYESLDDASNPARLKIIKFLEQSCRVLVLETRIGDQFQVVSICTKREQLDNLKQAQGSGTLQREFESFVTADEVLRKMQVLDVRLNISLSRDDLELSEEEFA